MNGIMLDFGCGSKPYKELFSVDKYIGLDIEKSGHNHKEEPIDFYYDGKTIPFKNEYLKFLMTILFISLFNLLGMILLFMLPKNNNFYHNSIIVAKKIADL